MKKYRRFLCKAIAFIFLISNLLVALPDDMQFVFAADNLAKNPKDVKVNYEDREKTELIVKYKPGKLKDDAKNRVKQSLKLTKMESKKRYSRLNVDILEIGKTDDINKVMSMLKSDPDVEYVQPNYKLEIQALPVDPRFNEQWGLLNNGQEVEGQVGRATVDINAANAWNTTAGAANVIVGILDTGVDINHKDLKNSIYVNTREVAGNGIDDDNNGYTDDISGWDFVNADNTVYDSSSLDLHGTHVAGIIAASADSEGITGVAPGVKIMPLKFINGNWGYTCDAIDAIQYAMGMGVKIMNCSFGGTDNNFALKDTMVNSGILFVSSAGNRGADVAVSPVYPACFDIPNILSVASIDSNGVISPYSSYGNKIHVAAPGINILSTTPDNTYDYYSGTSASAPFVTGIAALLKSHVPSLNYEQMAQRIKANVVPCTNLQGKVTSGGRVDANAVLTEIKPQPDTYTGPGNDTGTVPVGQQGGNEDTWYTQDQLAKIKEKLHYGEGGVNPASGNYSISSNDLSVPAPGFQINISRTYNSRDPKSTPLGQGWTFGFEGKVEGTDVVEVTLPSGGAQRFRLDKTTNKYFAEDSRSLFIKNADNTFLLTTKDQYKYHFNSNGYLYKMEDRNGNTVDIAVDGNGKITKITDAVGREFSVNYNASGLIENIRGPEDTEIRYGYDSNNRLTTVTDAEGGVMKYTYDTWGFIAEVKDHYDRVITKITYNHGEGENQHKVSQTVDAYGSTSNFTYDMTSRKTTVNDQNNRTTSYWFDSAMYTIQEQDPEGKSTYTEYFLEGGKNKYGDVKSVTDRNGNKTEYERDGMGNVIKIINPDRSFKVFSYDDKNNLTMEKDELGLPTYYIYDADKKLLLKEARPLNGTAEYTASSGDEGFAVNTYSYYTGAEALANFQTNAKGLLKSVTDPENNTTIYTYNIDGNIKTVMDAEQKITTYSYNRLGLLTEVLTPRNHRTSYAYDKNGLLMKTSLHGGETTRIVYDKLGRKTQEVKPKQYSSAVDDLENRSYGDSASGYRYVYNTRGLLGSVTDPQHNKTEYTYDVYGNKLTETRPNGSILRYKYDVLDRLEKVWFKADSTAPEILLYDYSYAILSDGRTQKTEIKYLNDTEKALTVEIFDYAGRLVEKQYPDGFSEKTVFSPNGLVNSQTARDGNITYFKYDKLNRLSEKWTPSDIHEGRIRYTYTRTEYDNSNRTTKEITGKQRGALYEIPTSDVKQSYTYYKDGKVKSMEGPGGTRTEYSYDDDGNLSLEEVYTDANNKLTAEYANNHLGKPTEKKVHVDAGDIYGNTFGSTADMVLLTSYTYDKNGNLETLTTPGEVTTTYTYDSMDRQLSISQPGVDEDGAAVTIENSTTYNWEGKPLTKTDARGNTTNYEYNAMGYLTKVIDAKGKVTAFDYDRAGRKTAEVSPANYVAGKSVKDMSRIEYVYDLMDRVREKLDIYIDLKTNQWVTVHAKSFKYDADGNVVKEMDALGYDAGTGTKLEGRLNTGYGIEYSYNLAGNLVAMLDPVSKQRGLAFTSRYEYDALGRETSVTNAKGVVTIYHYDDAGNVLSVGTKKNASAVEQTTKEYTYDLIGRRLTESDGYGNTVSYEYNALGRERRVTYPGDDTIESNQIVLQYDVHSNLKYKKDTMGVVELYDYDNQNRVLAFTEQNASGAEAITVSYRYDKNGNKRFETDGEGHTKENIYDVLNRLIEIKITVNSIEKSTKYDYDDNGNQTTVIDWRGNIYTNKYDPLNRLVEKSDPNTVIQRLEYNKNNQQSKSYDALDNLTQYLYDRNGRLITTIDPENHITSQTYDDAGNIQSKSDGRGITTVYNYDEFNRLLTVTDAKGTTQYKYDLNGNMLSQTDAKLQTTTFEYNVMNKLVMRIDHGGLLGVPGKDTYIIAKVEAYTYYADGSISTKKDRNGKTTEYSYDAHGRLASRRIGSDEVSYTYDDDGNQLTMTDSTGVTVRTYDEENRVTSKTVPDIGTITFQYDILEADGGYSEVSEDPKGNVAKKVFNKVNRLVEVIEGANATAFEYFNNGSRKSVVYPDNSREDYTYYKDGLLKSLVNTKSDGTILDSYSYTYDGAHNQTSKTDNKGITKYEYDGLNRLFKVIEPNGRTTSYQYDKAGNRTQETVVLGSTNTTTTYGYNEQNRLTETVTRSGFTTEKTRYEYDNNGNTLVRVKETTKPVDPEVTGGFAFKKAGTSTTREVSFMDYDVWNQMIKTVDGDKTLEYKYNGEGYRVEKAVNDQVTRYMYEADKVILEVDGQGNETAKNTYGTSLLTRTSSEDQYYYMYNGHGDVTALLGTNGEVAATYYYDAFGNITEQTGDAKNPIRYAGYQYDEETEIYYLNARYYDPKIARFLTEDTYRGQANDPLSLNLYTYCHNEPIMYYDPSGHIESCDYKLSKKDQKKILDLTEKYYNAKNEEERSAIHREAVKIRENSGKLNDYKDNYRYDIEHNVSEKEWENIKKEAKEEKRRSDKDGSLQKRGISSHENDIINGIIRDSAKSTNEIAPNQAVIRPAPVPVGVSIEQINAKADSYTDAIIMELMLANDKAIYNNSVLSARITELQTAINKYNGVKNIDLVLKIKDILKGKTPLGLVNNTLATIIEEAKYSPLDTYEFEFNKEIDVNIRQINALDNYNYLIVNNKHARGLFIKQLDSQFKEISKSEIHVYENDVNNEILKSRMLTNFYNVKAVNVNYRQSYETYGDILERVKTETEAEYTMKFLKEYKKLFPDGPDYN